MNVFKYINELKTERQGIDEAIAALERLAGSQPRRRGRPPKWLGSAMPDFKKRSPEVRRKMALAQRRRRAAEKE